MKIETRTVGDVRILDCSGKITLGEGTMAIRNTVRDVLKNGGKKIILNLADVNYIDSSGIGELVSTYTTVTNQGTAEAPESDQEDPGTAGNHKAADGFPGVSKTSSGARQLFLRLSDQRKSRLKSTIFDRSLNTTKPIRRIRKTKPT